MIKNSVFSFLSQTGRITKKYLSTQNTVFDRGLKRRQRDWSITIENSKYYDYLRQESAERLIDRLDDILRDFPLALELGSHTGHIFNIIASRAAIAEEKTFKGIKTLVQCDVSENAVEQGKQNSLSASLRNESNIECHHVICDEEYLPFQDDTFDLVLSSMNLHWVNDLPKTLTQIKRILKPDGVFVASMLGGNTLQELRYCFYLAEQERRGGLGPHASPFALASDVAGLMQGAGFNLPTVDVDTITVGYPDAFALMEHISRMGEGTAALNRQYSVGRDTFLAMAAIYQELYGLEDGTIPATFQIISMIGWSPHESQPKACRRGSATKSMKDI